MSTPSDNENWIIETGDVVIQKKAESGINSLSPIARLIYCLWVADYGMRDALVRARVTQCGWAVKWGLSVNPLRL